MHLGALFLADDLALVPEIVPAVDVHGLIYVNPVCLHFVLFPVARILIDVAVIVSIDFL